MVFMFLAMLFALSLIFVGTILYAKSRVFAYAFIVVGVIVFLCGILNFTTRELGCSVNKIFIAVYLLVFGNLAAYYITDSIMKKENARKDIKLV